MYMDEIYAVKPIHIHQNIHQNKRCIYFLTDQEYTVDYHFPNKGNVGERQKTKEHPVDALLLGDLMGMV